ncbi:MAG: phosphatidate cytidylyltransferase [Phycisphaerales bacterium]|nr:phosphatidate cytidylyltransferase [Phycisphaerales bacterium]
MNTRIFYGTLAIVMVLALVWLDAWFARNAPLSSALLARGSMVPLTIAALCGFSCLELASMLRHAGVTPYARWAALCCMALVVAPWIGASGLLGPAFSESMHAQMFVAAAGLLGAGFIAVLRHDVQNGLMNIAGTWLLIGYLGVLPSFLTILRCDLPGEHGAWIVLTLVLICKFCDIGAYFVGTAIGRHRLIPAVSPKKSVEGLLGGITASCGLALLFWYLQQSAQNAAAASPDPTHPGFLAVVTVLFKHLTVTQTLILGAVMAIVGQAGDLIESVFKRSAGAKDSGAVLPSFGGIFDMIDSPVAIAPFAWFLLTIVWEVL